MQVEQQNRVLDAFQLVLRPIIKILLRYGIGFSQFAETVKTAYVDVASSEFGIRGRPTNISRVAVMTGLTRKEVRRLRTKIEGGEDRLKVKTTPITEVLHWWHTDNDFLDEKGRPLVLGFSQGSPSFVDLVKKHGGDIPPGAMRTELKRIAAVEEDDDGNLRVVSRTFHPVDAEDSLISGLVHGAYPLFSTLEKNTQKSIAPGDGYAQFTVHTLAISKEDKQRVRRICWDRLNESAHAFDDLFNSYETLNDVSASADTSSRRPTVVGLYYFEEDDENVEYEW